MHSQIKRNKESFKTIHKIVLKRTKIKQTSLNFLWRRNKESFKTIHKIVLKRTKIKQTALNFLWFLVEKVIRSLILDQIF